MSAPDRLDLAKLARAAHGGVLSVDAATDALRLPRREVTLRLASLARRGWLVRVRRGLYVVPPLEAEPGKPTVVEDPWVLAREAFAPCYIGGWSAAEHWELTEQIFRAVLVVTAANVRERNLKLLGHEYRLFRIPEERFTDTVPVWRGSERVLVSNRERTIIDGLRYPEICGGLRNVVDIMREYGQRPDHDFDKLAATAERAGNGAVWKRFGYLVEILWPDEGAILKKASRHIPSGNVRLDPAVAPRGRLVKRWHLLINVPIRTDRFS